MTSAPNLCHPQSDQPGKLQANPLGCLGAHCRRYERDDSGLQLNWKVWLFALQCVPYLTMILAALEPLFGENGVLAKGQELRRTNVELRDALSACE